MSAHASTFSDDELALIQQHTWAGKVESLPSVSSTNDFLLTHRDVQADQLPYLVHAGQQTAGRGRGANRWWADEGTLTFSMLIDADVLLIPTERRPLISLVTGLAVAEACDAMLDTVKHRPQQNAGLNYRITPDARAQVKWPNDILIKSRKVSGILIEVPPESPQRFVVGIGLNVNTRFEQAPAGLARRATSLADIAGQRFPLTSVLVKFLHAWKSQLMNLSRMSFCLVEHWQSRCWLSGQKIEVTTPTRTVSGLCHGVDPEGSLVVETVDGMQALRSGVAVRRNS